MKVDLVLLKGKDSTIPYKTYDSDFCYDVVATWIKDHGDGRIEYGLGIALQIDKSEFKEGYRYGFKLKTRSSVHKTGLILSNGSGMIDQCYTGEFKAVFYNIITSLPNYKVGDRIGQICISCTKVIEFNIVDKLIETERNDNGYGHTGN